MTKKRKLTRSIKVSCLSRFLQRASCYLDKSGMRAAPGYAHYSQLNPATMTNYWLRGKLCHDTAPCTLYSSETTMTISLPPCNLCHDTRIPQLNPTWMAKTRAIPSWHRDCFSAEEPGSARCVRRVTQPPFIAVPLGVINTPPEMLSYFKNMYLQ